MRFVVPPAELVPFGLRALKTISTVEQPLSEAVANVLAAAQAHFLGTSYEIDQLDRIEPRELATQIIDPALRRQFIQAMLVVAMADSVPSRAQLALIDDFARALKIDAPEVKTFRLLADEHLLFRLDFVRHTHLARLLKRSLQDDGLLATAKQVLGMRGLVEDPALAARYRALKSLPSNTLGYAYLEYAERNHFPVPGERGGFPERGLFHDFGHVLTGFGTDPRGEVLMAAFQAGFMKDEPLFMLLFGVVTFGAGMNLTPLPQPGAGGIFRTPGLIAEVFDAVERGAGLTVDLSTEWDHWAFVERPLNEVREALHLRP